MTGRAEPRRAQGAVNAPRKLSRFDSCPSHQWLEEIEHDHGEHETPVKCIQCGCPGMRGKDDRVFWPAT